MIAACFIVLIICFSLLLYKQKIRISLPFFSTIEKGESKTEKKPIPWRNLGTIFLNFCLLLLLISFICGFGRKLVDFIKNSVWTSPFQPVARFVVKVDWDNKKIKLDASMSKSYKNKFKQLIWRIDDGKSYFGSQIEHQFKHPGYYTIKLSVIDTYDNSDQAICTLNIPPSKVQTILYKEISGGGENATASVEKFKYIPAETYFNYSKHYGEDSSASDLQSPSISTDCGLSDRSYDTSSSDITGQLKSLLDLILLHGTILIFIILFQRFFLAPKKPSELKATE